MPISPSKLASLPSAESANANFMMQNPQYGYNAKAPTTQSVSKGTATDTPAGWTDSAWKQQQADMAKYFPTVISTADKLDKTIPELKQKGDKIAKEVVGKTTTATTETPKEESLSDIYKMALGEADTMSQFQQSPEQKMLFDMMQNNLDAQTQASLSAIQQSYGQQQQLLVESQKASSKGLENVLNLGGSARYAPVSSMGLVQAKNRYDLQTLNELQAKEQAAKAAVLQAQREGNFQIMEKKLNALETLRKEKLAFANKVAESVAQQNKEIKDRIYESEKELQKNLTSIKIDVAKNNAPEDVRDAVNNSTTLEEALSNAGDYLQTASGDLGSYLYYKKEAQNAGQTPLSYLDFIQKKTNIEKASNLAGTSDTSFDQFTKEQIALSVIPVQLRNSEVEHKRYLSGIKMGLTEGKTPFEIADALIGYKINNPDDFSAGIRQYIALANLSTQEIGNVSRLINSGNKAGAISVIENKMMNEQKKLDPDGYVGESTARYYANKVSEIKKQIEDNGLMDAIGPLEGTAESISGRFKSGEAAKVMSKVTSLVAEMRNHLSGTAVTESEKKFLEPLISSLSDKKGIFITKLDEIKDNSLLRLNQVRKSAQLPELYEEQLLDRNKRAEVYSQSQIIGDQIISEQEEQEKALKNYKINNPSKVNEINAKIVELEAIVGRPIDASEFYEQYPQYK